MYMYVFIYYYFYMYFIVVSPPDINIVIHPLNHYGTYEGQDVTITCSVHLSSYVDSNVTTAIHWVHNNHQLEVSTDDTYSIVSGEMTSSVHINGVNGTYSGEYTCEATVSSWSVETTNSNTNEEPTIIIIPSDITKESVQLNIQGMITTCMHT